MMIEAMKSFRPLDGESFSKQEIIILFYCRNIDSVSVP